MKPSVARNALPLSKLSSLAGYGADGVRNFVETLRTEQAREMSQLGKVTVRGIRRDRNRIDRR